MRLTSSSSCRNLCNCASSCRLWSSSICMRASSRPLCCRSNRASATMSPPPPLLNSSGVLSGVPLLLRRSYSACSWEFSSSSSLRTKTLMKYGFLKINRILKSEVVLQQVIFKPLPVMFYHYHSSCTDVLYFLPLFR